jgi:hypothetical protein
MIIKSPMARVKTTDLYGCERFYNITFDDDKVFILFLKDGVVSIGEYRTYAHYRDRLCFSCIQKYEIDENGKEVWTDRLPYPIRVYDYSYKDLPIFEKCIIYENFKDAKLKFDELKEKLAVRSAFDAFKNGEINYITAYNRLEKIVLNKHNIKHNIIDSDKEIENEVIKKHSWFKKGKKKGKKNE